MKAVSVIQVITKSNLSCCVSIRRVCTLVLSTHFFECPIGRAGQIARPKNRTPKKKFVHPCFITQYYQFTLCSDVHNYRTVSSTADKKLKLSYRTDPCIKTQYLQEPLITGIKLNISSVICNLKHSPTKINSLLFKNSQ